LADGLRIAGISGGQPLDARLDPSAPTQVPQVVEPRGELGRLADLQHRPTVALRLQLVKPEDAEAGVVIDANPRVFRPPRAP